MSEKRKFVSDYDGTVTDSWAETIPYVGRYTELLASRIGMDKYELAQKIQTAQQEITAHPTLYGWEFPSVQGNDLIIAPATVDPYIYLDVSARIVLNQLLKENAHLKGLKGEDITEVIEKNFAESYPSTGNVLREGADDYVDYLRKTYDLVIVTNSSKAKVEAKLRLAFPDQDFTVVGNARKMLVDEEWEGVPVSIQPEGFPRPVFLRRSNYGQVLSDLGGNTGIAGVAGDIFELDLALPGHMGLKTFFLSEHASDYEKSFYSGGIKNKANNLNGLTEHIRRFR